MREGRPCLARPEALSPGAARSATQPALAATPLPEPGAQAAATTDRATAADLIWGQRQIVARWPSVGACVSAPTGPRSSVPDAETSRAMPKETTSRDKKPLSTSAALKPSPIPTALVDCHPAGRRAGDGRGQPAGARRHPLEQDRPCSDGAWLLLLRLPGHQDHAAPASATAARVVASPCHA